MISAFVQSLFIQHEQVLIVSQNCGPFGCSEVTSIDFEKTIKLRQDAPLGKYNGINTYLNRSHLAFAEVGNAWSASETLVDFFNEVFVVGVNYDQPNEDILMKEKELLKVGFPTLKYDPRSYFGLPPVSVLPETLIIDHDGTLLHRLIGPQTKSSIESLIIGE